MDQRLRNIRDEPVKASEPAIFIGCAGWSLPSAHAATFGDGGSHLERYARVFNAVEINSSFYRPHLPRTYARWADSVPEGFRFAVKMPKTISHAKRLRDCNAEVRAFLDQVQHLGARLGVLLLQLPPSLHFEPHTAMAFFTDLRARHERAIACEPRHRSWFGVQANALLREFGIARAAADPACTPRAAVPAGDERLEYLRLHGSPRMYYDAYSDPFLARIARRIERSTSEPCECWCMFDNTAQGHAIGDALKLNAMLRN